MPSIFFVAPEEVAKKFRLNHKLPPEDGFECGMMENLKISMLWAIFTHQDWMELIGFLPEVLDPPAKINWVWRIPEPLIDLFVGLTPEAIEKAAGEWCVVEEVPFEKEIAVWLITGMKRIAIRAKEKKQGMYLFLSL